MEGLNLSKSLFLMDPCKVDAGEQVGHKNVNGLIVSVIWVKETRVTITPLSTSATKVTISNVPPFICDDVNVKELTRFRKTVGEKTLDVYFRVIKDKNSYMVYGSTESLGCFECVNIEHKRFTCPHKKCLPDKQDPPAGTGISTVTECFC
ncbi:scavenger receptor cysteine-rich type 1 protein M130-like [Tachysurus ichikawai]